MKNFMSGLLDRNIWGVKTPAFYRQLAAQADLEDETSSMRPRSGTQTLAQVLGPNFPSLLKEAENESLLSGGLGFVTDLAFTPKNQGYGSIVPYALKAYGTANKAASQPFAALGENINTMTEYNKSNLTDDIKEYNFAVSQGEKDSFTAWKAKQKRAGAMNVYTGKTMFDKSLEGVQAIRDQGQTARNNIMETDMMIDILTPKELGGRGMQTGFGSQAGLAIKRAINAVEPDFKADELNDADLFTAYVNKVILPQVKELGYNPTDADLRFVTASAPGLAKKTGGNMILLELAKLKQQKAIAKDQFTQQWMNENRNLLDTEAGGQALFIDLPGALQNFDQQWEANLAQEGYWKNLRARVEALQGDSGRNTSGSTGKGYNISPFTKKKENE